MVVGYFLKKMLLIIIISFQITSTLSSGTKPKIQPQSVIPRNEIKKQQEEVPDKICQYCKLEFTQKQLDEHEDYCGKYLQKETIQTTLKENDHN